jgi:Protein of unknown function DUF262
MRPDTLRDIEESEEILDADPGDPVEFWARKQKELVTGVVDYNLSTIADLVTDDTINLEPRYQRRFRWDHTKQSRLIESFLMNVPVPPIFLNEDEYGKYSIIDGKQRLSVVKAFLNDALTLSDLKMFPDINGMRFSDLPPTLRNVLRTRPTIRAVIILRQSDKDLKYEVFQRLNTGGAALNAQEIRNNTFYGPLNDLVMDLSENREFHRALGIKNKHTSAIYREMRDAEFVLRFFTFRNSWSSFRGGIRRTMDKFMDDNREASPENLEGMRKEFQRTLAVVMNIFGEGTFRRWVPEKGSWRRQVIASLYDAQMFSCQYFREEHVEAVRDDILERYKMLFEAPEFRRTIDAATNTPALFKERISQVKILLENHLEE